MARALQLRGNVEVQIEDDAEAKEWRRAARAAGRMLHRSVQTVRAGRTVVAVLRDWPSNELERQVLNAQMDAAAAVFPLTWKAAR